MLTSLREDWVTQKPTTSICICLLAISAVEKKEHMVRAIMPAAMAVCVAALAAATPALGGLLRIFDDSDSKLTIAENMPSALTLTVVLITGLAHLLHAFRLRGCATWYSGYLALSASCGVALGYLFHVPLLMGYIPGVSTAMALHTAVGLGLIGAGDLLEVRRGDCCR